MTDSLADRLVKFIAAQMPDARDMRVENVTPISGGNARLAHGFDVTWSEGGTAKQLACVTLSQAEAGQLDSDLSTEFRAIRLLDGTGVPVARALWLDADGTALGSKSMISERAAGIADIGKLLKAAPGASRAIAENFAEIAARLHAVDWRGRGFDFLGVPDPKNVALAQVMTWESLFLKNRMEPHPILRFAFGWLKAHAPVAKKIALVHGDFRFGNFLYDGDRINALLDWEMVHLGDPAEDLAWAYHPLWSPELHLPWEAFVACYKAAGGDAIPADNLLFYRLFGEVKHSVISLNAARSFSDGKTRNIRLSDRVTMVTDCLTQFLDWLPA